MGRIKGTSPFDNIEKVVKKIFLMQYLGGIKIANFNVTRPFVRMFIDGEKIVLRIVFGKELVIKRHEIISIEPYPIIPVIGQRIKIKLNKEKKYGKLFSFTTDMFIFWTFINRYFHFLPKLIHCWNYKNDEIVF